MTDGSSAGRKWMWGCTGGCFGLIVVGIIAIVGLIWYVIAAVPVVPPETFLLGQSTAFAIVRIEPDDTLMMELPFRIVAHPEVRRHLPEQQVDPQAREANLEQARDRLRRLAPLQAVGLLLPVEAEQNADEPTFTSAAVFSVRGYSRVFRLLLLSRLQEHVTEEYRDAAIVERPEQPRLAFRENNFIGAERMETVHALVDRIVEQREREAAAPPDEVPRPELDLEPRLQEAYERLPQNAPVRFACLNEQGEMAYLAERLGIEQNDEMEEALGLFGPDVLLLSGTLEPVDATDADFMLRWDFHEEASAQAAEEGLRRLLEELPDEPDLEQLRLDRPEPKAVRVRVRIRNLSDLVARLAAAAPQQVTLPEP